MFENPKGSLTDWERNQFRIKSIESPKEEVRLLKMLVDER